MEGGSSDLNLAQLGNIHKRYLVPPVDTTEMVSKFSILSLTFNNDDKFI